MATGVSQLPPAKVSVTPMPWKNTPGICGMTASAVFITLITPCAQGVGSGI